jgi:glycosyltransferase involved in cell wall biosynthesis
VIQLVYRNRSRFTDIDRDALAARWEVVESRSWRVALRTDALVIWFAGAHAVPALLVAKVLRRRPVLAIVGGIDTANLPEIGYGFQRGGWRRPVSRWVMRRADVRMVNSEFARGELQANVGLDAVRLHHGVPDPFGSLPSEPRARMALTVGVVDQRNLMRKGIRPFVEAAALLPDVEFVVAGKDAGDGAMDALRAVAGLNVRFTGFVSDSELDDLYRRASVYVQASQHEGFGMSVAEAMLAGAIPVVTPSGALPEVVGDAGVVARSASASDIAEAVRSALGADDAARAAARERAVREFPLSMRVEGLQRLVADLLRN